MPIFRVSAREHPWKYGLIWGGLYAAITTVLFYLADPKRAVIPLLIATAGAGLVYAFILAMLYSKWHPKNRFGSEKRDAQP